MKNLWSDKEAKNFVNYYSKSGINEDLSLRVYTSRLLGNEKKLVLHGGGNTSVKSISEGYDGKKIDILYIKGSGWDLGNIEPEGLPAVRLNELIKLLELDHLSDEDMVNAQRNNLLNSSAPTPSVETLLHALIPYKFVDHTHSDAILSISDQKNSKEIISKVYGNDALFIPYIMPGFILAKKARAYLEKSPKCKLMILDKHGIFTFGDTANSSYSSMIKYVTKAERYISKNKSKILIRLKDKKINKILSPEKLAPIIRGILKNNKNSDYHNNIILNFRTNRKIIEYLNGDKLFTYSQKGTVTPDHVIRTKISPLVLDLKNITNLNDFEKIFHKELNKFIRNYNNYFQVNNIRAGKTKVKLDSLPRIILIRGLGLFSIGSNYKNANITGDLAETNINVILDAEKIGNYQPISKSAAFNMEYWSLEQAKLKKSISKEFDGKIVVITGGSGSIGLATAKEFKNLGAEVVILDNNKENIKTVPKCLNIFSIFCDVTSTEQIEHAFNKIILRYGGIDIVISNAGAAWTGKMIEVSDKDLRKSFELNFFSHQYIAKCSVKIMMKQGIGGCLLFNTSKQSINPGDSFGPYGLPKATTLFLSRQYALEYGKFKIRSNAVNADRIRSGIVNSEFIGRRASARGISKGDYMSGNLLGQEVLAKNVAKAFVDLASSEATTGAVLTVDGGNISAALR